MDDKLPELQPELKDILEMIHRFNVCNAGGCFLFSFMGFQKNTECKCEDCGEHMDEIDESKSMYGMFGDLYTVREMLSRLRDVAEDEVDENDFVNI